MALTSPSARPRRLGSNFSGCGMGSSAISSMGAGVDFCSLKPSPARKASSSSRLTVSIMWWYKVAQARVGVEVESAGEQLVERLVKLLARFSEMPGLENPARPRRTRPGSRAASCSGPSGRLNGKRRQNFVLRIERQREEQDPGLAAAGRSGRAGLVRRLGGVFATCHAEKYTGGNEKPADSIFERDFPWEYFWTNWTRRPAPPSARKESTMPAKL